jgi:hypothetical protein
MFVENLLNNPDNLQLYLKTIKGWNSYSKQFVNFNAQQVNNYIPNYDSQDTKKVLFIGYLYGISPATYSETIFDTYLNGVWTTFNFTPSNISGVVTNCLPQPIQLPIIMDGFDYIAYDNLFCYNFQGYMFYSN